MAETATFQEEIIDVKIVCENIDAEAQKKPPHISRIESVQEEDEKKSSMSDLRPPLSRADSETNYVRRRSSSAPVTLQASNIAKELTRMSDSLHTMYSSFGKKGLQRFSRTRRYTFGVLTEKRQSFHFDYDTYNEVTIDEQLILTDELPGTSV